MGELEKRIETNVEAKIGSSTTRDAMEEIVKVVSEAKKEFPKSIEDEIDYVPGTYPIYPEVKEWFVKWFGNSK